MLDIRRLRLLLEVQRRGTIRAAADALGYTPSAVSQQLAALEREAGVSLLERDGRRVRPTPTARALLERTERILTDLEAAELELASARTEPAGAITAGAFPTGAETLLIPACAQLRKRYPRITTAIRQILPEPGIEQLRNGQLDLLIAKRYDHVPAPAAGGLIAHDLLTEKLVVAVPAEHPAAGRPLKLLSLPRRIGSRASSRRSSERSSNALAGRQASSHASPIAPRTSPSSRPMSRLGSAWR